VFAKPARVEQADYRAALNFVEWAYRTRV
jgi:hypothetical protein